MVADGKENLHPNSPRIHDSNHIGTKSKQTILGNSFSFNQISTPTSRPLLFSEILFNNSNGSHLSTSCTDSASNTSLNLNTR